jgi:nucleoside-diphosphate-sugar epimerase
MAEGARRMRDVLVLGGSGFIGTRLTQVLMEEQIPVRVGDLRRSEAFPHIWTRCDVRDAESVARAAADCDAIVNLAAEHRDDVFPISRYHETNVDGASNVCAVAEHLNIAKIVFTSSAAVYGFQPNAVNENGPLEPFNEYGRTKLAAERIYRNWYNQDSKRTLVVVRPTVVFGEGNRGNVYNLLHQIASGRFLMVGSGENVKSMAYVENVARFLAYALSLAPGEYTYNYVDGPDMTTRQLVHHVRNCLGKPGSIVSFPKPVAMAGAHALDAVARITGRSFPISAIRIRKFCENTQFRAERAASSGFIPAFSLAEGLMRTIHSEFSELLAHH